MAKKSEIPVPTTLIYSPDDLVSKLKRRIDIGKELLKIDIKLPYKDPYNDPFAYTHRRNKRNTEIPEFKEFKSNYYKWSDYNEELLKQAFTPQNNEYHAEYKSIGNLLMWDEGEDPVMTYKSIIKSEIECLEQLIEKLPLIPVNPNVGAAQPIKANQNKMIKLESKDVFIVHGHDEVMKLTAKDILTQLGLHPIILHEQANGGRTIIEKLEGESSNSGFAVILLTADDIGKSKEEREDKPRGRQNVVFEMGYFIGRLGRSRVVVLHEEGVEEPGDMSGVVYLPIDKRGAWKIDLVKELKAAGYNVSADSLLQN